MGEMEKNFEIFMSQLTETNATLDYFTDFVKIKSNVDKISVRLNQLNFLLGKDNLKNAVEKVFDENPKAFNVLDILIAVRKERNIKVINAQLDTIALEKYFESPALIVEYLEQTGLADVFRKGGIKNLEDYVFGVEAGLDTNARKNRSGQCMTNAVTLAFRESGIFFKTELKSVVFPEIASLGVDVKQFDFAIKTRARTHLVEVNYYNTGGSKLNEVARSYSDLAIKLNQYPEYNFVWITDGQGWFSAKNKLEEAFYIIHDLYNLATLGDFILKVNSEAIISSW